MFKLLVLASLLAVALAAPADVIATKQADSSITVDKNDPFNPNDDTVTKKQSVSESVTKTDGNYSPGPGYDKNIISILQFLFGLYGFPQSTNPIGYTSTFNSFANMYNPFSNMGYNPFNPSYNPLFNPKSSLFSPSYNPNSLYSPSYTPGPKY